MKNSSFIQTTYIAGSFVLDTVLEISSLGWCYMTNNGQKQNPKPIYFLSVLCPTSSIKNSIENMCQQQKMASICGYTEVIEENLTVLG